ncbi:MAG: YjgP/YjgQ family permease [Lentisphaerae bacterium]|nr:YjgP/YjgQ family permease [Lentisphaerota bacterium]
MKILDRYILKQYFIPLIFCFVTFMMIFVIFDLFVNLGDFIEKKISFMLIAKYYSFAMPGMLLLITPISLLLAMLYVMYQFSRHNELIAMWSSGISMYRIVTPFVALGLIASLTLTAVNETVTPQTSMWVANFFTTQGKSASVLYELSYKNRIDNREWTVDKFDRKSNVMYDITIKQNSDQKKAFEVFKVEKAEWCDGILLLSGVKWTKHNGDQISESVKKPWIEMLDWSETPSDFSQHNNLFPNVTFKNESAKREWAIEMFNPETSDMYGVSLTQFADDGSSVKIFAEKVEYQDGKWWFYTVSLRNYDQHNAPKGRIDQHNSLEMTDLDESPKIFEGLTKNDEFKSSIELFNYLKWHPQLAPAYRAKIAVDMHSRLAMPWSCLIVILFGIPSGVFTGRKGAMTGIILALGTFFGFYVLAAVCAWAGKKGAISPVLSAWIPNMFFFLLGLFWMRKLR